ncbi:MAG: hemolysin III family protein [Sphaerochaetaceae bacterium]|nr:hemolysin III family protein [Sphaerochaetaceae bacterium]
MKQITAWIDNTITLKDNVSGREERANTVTHLIASVAALGYLIFVIINGQRFPTTKVYGSMILFSLTQLLLFSSSTFYHWAHGGTLKRVGRILDHLNIYLLIWGTYIPILMYTASSWASLLFGFLTFFLVMGSTFTIVFWGRMKALHVVLYLLMGWSITLVWNDVVVVLPPVLFVFVIGGGVTYTLGVIFYAIKRLPFAHAVWHVFCLLASALFSTGFLITFLTP